MAGRDRKSTSLRSRHQRWRWLAMKSGRIETDPVYRRQRAQNRRHSAPIAYSELPRQLTDTVTVTDTRMERIPCRARWSLKRLGAHADARCACVIDEEKTKKRPIDVDSR
jgi:hypothetical protein